MIVGCTKELKDNEFRVGLTPGNVSDYIGHGHEVLVETGAGVGAGFSDAMYEEAGAVVCAKPEEVFGKAEMIVKVKEPEVEERDLLREGQILYTYLHLAANFDLAKFLIERGVAGVAYETITDQQGSLPCLAPMSQIAGRLSIQEGAKYLERECGGRGLLLGGVPGVQKGNILILGGGTAGMYACKAAVGIGANVTVISRDARKLAMFEDTFGSKVTTLYSNESNIVEALEDADLVVGCALIPGGSTPKLIKREHLPIMKDGSVIVDVSIDQGGCAESSHTTTHSDPVYIEDGVVHYCVGNMPGAVPFTSTLALTNATFRYGLLIADKGLQRATEIDRGLLNGINTYNKKCVHYNVASALGLQYTRFDEVVS